MKIAHINFLQGSFKERITHVVPVNTSVLIHHTNLCRAARFTATADLDTYGVVSGVKSVVMAIRPSANTKLLQDDGADRFEITGGNFSGTGLTECTVSSVDTDAALLGQWQLVIAEFSAGINFATDLEIDPTAILDVAWIVLDDTILTTAEKDAYYQDFLNTHGNQEVALKTIGILQVDREWEEVAPKLGAEIQIYSLAVHNGRLFGGTSSNGKLYRWNESNDWEEVAPKLGAEKRILSLAVHNERLFGGTYPNGKLYRWNESNDWEEVAPQLGAEKRIHSLAVHNGRLFGGTYPNGKLYRWNESNDWEEVAPQLGAETNIRSLAVHNERLFGGTSSNGKLYRAQMAIGTDVYPLVDTLFSDDLTNANADGVTQTVFIDQYRINSGTFRNKEDATGKYRECVTDGSISLEGIDLSAIVGNGYIKTLTGDLSANAGLTVDASALSFADNVISIPMTAGQVIRNITIARDAG